MDAGPRKRRRCGDKVNEHSFILHNSPRVGKDFRNPLVPESRPETSHETKLLLEEGLRGLDADRAGAFMEDVKVRHPRNFGFRVSDFEFPPTHNISFEF
jgi:hypothetical protein